MSIVGKSQSGPACAEPASRHTTAGELHLNNEAAIHGTAEKIR